MKKILFIASEAVPFIKTGGLADVVGSLPKCFDKEYFDVRVMIPKYLWFQALWRLVLRPGEVCLLLAGGSFQPSCHRLSAGCGSLPRLADRSDSRILKG